MPSDRLGRNAEPGGGVLAAPGFTPGAEDLELPPGRSHAAFMGRPFGRHRPFAIASRVFCDGVPKNRWPGRTHGGLSQVWQTNMPLGISASPLARRHETRWAASILP